MGRNGEPVSWVLGVCWAFPGPGETPLSCPLEPSCPPASPGAGRRLGPLLPLALGSL